MGRLFRNDLEVRADGTRSLRFTDVTRESAIRATQYGLGVAAGDIDNDGWVDLLLTNFGANQLWRNNRDGTFSDVTAAIGLTDDLRFAVSAAFVDFDRDGWLDLYVANNVNYTVANETKCPNPAGRRDYCPPQIYGGRPDQLYRNQRNGTFADVTAKALVGGRFGPALGVSTADFNGDGWIDVFVANDGEDNLLWLNQRDGTLRESGLIAGVAVTAEGKAEASMGVDAGDFDNDGDEDLIITELTGEGSNLYVNDGTAKFRDMSAASGLSAIEPALHRLGHRRGSTSTTTGGSTPSRPTERSWRMRGRPPTRSRTTSARCSFATSGPADSRTSLQRPAQCSDYRSRGAARHSETSTTTATSTSSSATPPDGCGC